MHRLLKVLLILLVGIDVLYCCGFYAAAVLDYNPNLFPKGITDFPDDQTGYYRIDPETILASLERGEMDVFVPALVPVPALVQPETVFNRPVSWHQEDYLKVADAVFRSVWKESFDGWSLLRMIFNTACQDNPNGFERGDLLFFKTEGESEYATRRVIIDPRDASVTWGGGRNFPRFYWRWKGDFLFPGWGWKSINMNRLRVSADEALRIAEENGGRTLRLATGNRCHISMILDIDAYGDWQVDYSAKGGYYFIQINPYTGKVRGIEVSTPTLSP